MIGSNVSNQMSALTSNERRILRNLQLGNNKSNTDPQVRIDRQNLTSLSSPVRGGVQTQRTRTFLAKLRGGQKAVTYNAVLPT